MEGEKDKKCEEQEETILRAKRLGVPRHSEGRGERHRQIQVDPSVVFKGSLSHHILIASATSNARGGEEGGGDGEGKGMALLTVCPRDPLKWPRERGGPRAARRPLTPLPVFICNSSPPRRTAPIEHKRQREERKREVGSQPTRSLPPSTQVRELSRCAEEEEWVEREEDPLLLTELHRDESEGRCRWISLM